MAMASALRTNILRTLGRYSRLCRRTYADGGDFKKTTVTLLNKEQDGGILFDTYSPLGFRLNNGLMILGPCAAFPRSVLQWNVSRSEEINEDSLTLFTLLEPKLDILVIGIGERGSKFDLSIIRYLRSKKINVEILPTDQALPTFNFLNSERRLVAGAFIPPSYVESRFYQEGPQPTAFQSLSEDLYKMGDTITFAEHKQEVGELEGWEENIEKGLEELKEKGGHRFWTGTVFKLPKHQETSQEIEDERKLAESEVKKPGKDGG